MAQTEIQQQIQDYLKAHLTIETHPKGDYLEVQIVLKGDVISSDMVFAPKEGYWRD